MDPWQRPLKSCHPQDFPPSVSFKSYFADFDDFDPIPIWNFQNFSAQKSEISVTKMKVYFSGNDFLFWFRFQFMVFDKEQRY